MIQEENVYEQNTQTGAVARATEQNGEDCEAKEAPTVLGKFKDVNALMRAYSALEAEFTRRSQKLKELERKVGNCETAQNEKTENGGVEKLRMHAEQRRREERDFDKFVAELGTANTCAAKASKEAETQSTSTLYEDGGQNAEQMGIDKTAEIQTQMQVLPEKQLFAGGKVTEQDGASAPGTEKTSVASVAEDMKSGTLSSEELFQKVKADEGVRLRIIGEYLSSIGKTAAPLMHGGTGTLAVPPVRPKSFGEAGAMALRFFQKDGMEA